MIRIKRFTTGIVLATMMGCSTVPITGRRQLNLLPESEMMSMSLTQYQQFISENKTLPDSDPKSQMVKRIGERLAAAATKFLKENGAADRVKDFQWEFHVVDDPQVNAWCMPGGKVVVYTGLLPITQDEPSLALVMGHEIAHAIARHGNERMSQGMAVQGAGMTLQVLASEKPTMASDLFLQSFGIGSQLGLLAYGRKQESEADKMGLVFMAMGGYDPRIAPAFWQRMAAQGGAKPPELLSTHPSDERRIADIEAYMPEAMKYYKPR
ncbi:MAG: M48 family metallopeptidase [Flavobacteriales bacterium]|nr:M48 family metallopeptidase [Flavobacteriales bacterium]MBK7247764.1 M48 family metallopeptidase [Flavobacteriales bacterium]MBK9060401.1 M48 family metallopeptidase [Flavobacteriales bacterium]MBK9597134.1 M48 family metallopeptidase [Flavobacteriales bacterium]QQS73035.1 MAG: M48 family metallopeptidase [Flavobacteriales bacterium]